MPEPCRVDRLKDAKKQKNTVIRFLSFYKPCINCLVRISGTGIAESIAGKAFHGLKGLKSLLIWCFTER